MPTIKLDQQYSLLNLANKDGNGNVIPVVEVLTKTNKMFEDAPWIKANNGLSNLTWQRISRGTGGQKRQINQGVKNSSGATKTITDEIVMVEAYSEIDKVLADRDGSTERQNEAQAQIAEMADNFADLILYDTKTSDAPMSIDGMATRLNAIDNVYVRSGGGSSNLSSIYIVQWGLNQTNLFYPQFSSTRGVNHDDLGQVTLFDDVKGKFEGYRDHFQIYGGLAVQDDRCIARIANIDVTDLDAFGSEIENMLIAVMNEMPQQGAGAIIYVNSQVKTQFDIRAKDKSNVFYGPDDVWGNPQLMFQGKKVKLNQAIKSNESVVA